LSSVTEDVKEEEIKEEEIIPEEIPVEEEPKKTRVAVPLEEYMLPKMRALLDMNTETVGWVTVPGTNIDYPVVKGNDNKFYLEHNYDKKRDYNGWVFMNTYNNIKDLDKNTILFAHNRYYSGVMFGTLSNLTKDTWYNNAKNNRITFNSMFEEMQWEVFSIYNIKVTDDYLQTTFDSDEEYMSFIQMLRDRSIYHSDVIIDENDKILTLSTCLENNERLVIHAVLK
jgi:sortase B